LFLRIFLTLIILVSLFSGLNDHFYQISYAHDFFVNNDATLVTLVEQIKAETQLINTKFLSGNNSSAQLHAKNTAELMNDLEDNMTEALLPSSDIAQVYDDGQRNSTSLALVVANIVDDILRKYGTAFDIGYDLTNMSNMAGMRMSNLSDGASSSHSMDMTVTGTINIGNDTLIGRPNTSTVGGNDSLLDDDYGTAQILADNVNKIFSEDLRPQSPVSETVNLDKLEKNLSQLKNAIEIKASPEALMEIVHIQIHPTLQKIYDLKLLDTLAVESSD
jgi:hypothetical protein